MRSERSRTGNDDARASLAAMARAFNCMVCACLLAAVCLCAPLQAFADVRKSDILYGQTMEERGISPTSCPNIGAEYAYVCGEDGTEYYSRNGDSPTQIASITKVMTAIIALESSDMQREVTVSSAAANVGGSTADLRAGDVITMENALKCLMIPSGNDAAVAIAETLGPDFRRASKESGETLHLPNGDALDADDPAKDIDAFVAKMNQKAQEIGCQDTVFTNPHGLDSGEFGEELHSTASEVSKICRYAMGIEQFPALCDVQSAEVPVKRGDETTTITLETTDLLLGAYDGACGIKTGNAELAGPCFAGACNKDSMMLYAIVLDSTSEDQRFKDCTALYDWVYGNWKDYALANSPDTTQMTTGSESREVPVVAEAALSSWVDETYPVTFADPDAAVRIFAPNGNVSQEFAFDELSGVSAGQKVGVATFYQRNEKIAEVDLVACEDVPAPNIFESIGIWWDKMMLSLAGEPTQAQSVIINETPLVLEKD
ncbi:MAG: D-alanyl-D-alanine carboxypeptidase [Eggerthellaceae bacterium]|nr:D-alanyl-D-alanine carboxypeptidase [Eggerthellaceae bacterium]